MKTYLCIDKVKLSYTDENYYTKSHSHTGLTFLARWKNCFHVHVDCGRDSGADDRQRRGHRGCSGISRNSDYSWLQASNPYWNEVTVYCCHLVWLYTVNGDLSPSLHLFCPTTQMLELVSEAPVPQYMMKFAGHIYSYFWSMQSWWGAIWNFFIVQCFPLLLNYFAVVTGQFPLVACPWPTVQDIFQHFIMAFWDTTAGLVTLCQCAGCCLHLCCHGWLS